jgi:putative ATPase
MPEARINLAQAVTYLACAPKSNASYEAINQAMAEVRKSGALSVPMHLRNAPTALMKREGYAAGYKYAHAQKGARVRQTHLPESLLGNRFYQPKDSGYEKQLKLRLDELNSDFDPKNQP